MRTVSAAITTFKRPEQLARAIQSVESQSIAPAELIVVDNDKAQSAKEVVLRCSTHAPFDIRYVAEAKPGASAARNRGLLEATGEFVAFLDDDDVWLPHHLLSFHQLCEGREGIALFGAYRARYGAPEQLVLPQDGRLFEAYEKDARLKLLTRPKSPLTQPFFTPSMSSSVINRALACQVLFDEELAGREDICFVWLLAEVGDILIHQEVHELADQLETSLFSVADGAHEDEVLRMALKKARYGVMMLERVVDRTSKSPELMHELSSAYFDAGYFQAKAGNSAIALGHLLRSLQIQPERRHAKLAFRVLLSLFRKRFAEGQTPANSALD